MCYAQFNIGHCCDEPFAVDVINADNDESVMSRSTLTAAGGSVIWNENYAGSYGADCIEGANYAPSFSGGALAQLKSGQMLPFSFEDGSGGAPFGSSSTVAAGTGNVYQECNGYVVFTHRTSGVDRMFIASSAGTITERSGPLSQTSCAVRAADGVIWKTRPDGACKLYDHGATVLSDLSAVALTSVVAHGVVSTNGVDFYALGYNTGGTLFELFHSDASGAPTRLGGGSCSSNSSCGALTKIGNWIFWSNADNKIWRYRTTDGTFENYLTKSFGTWGTWYGPGQMFFVPN